MIAYKFLSRGAVGPFSGFRWPTPAGDAPGAWVDATGEAPTRWVHACRPSDLPYWIDEELWVAELAGEVRAMEHQLVAPRGRLLGPVEAWRDLARAFAEDCAATLRARVCGALAGAGVTAETAERLRGYAADAEACAQGGNGAVAAFVAAQAAVVLSGDQAGFTAERRRQAAWLEQRLVGATGSPPPRA